MGFSATYRKVRTPVLDLGFDLAQFDHAREDLHEAYVAWLPSPRTAVRAGLAWERFRRDHDDTVGDDPTRAKTTLGSVSVHHSFDGSAFAKFVVTSVRHKLTRLPDATAPSGSDRFTLFDASLGVRLPQRRGVVRLEIKNAFNEKFHYYDVNFFSPEPRNPRFVPARVIMLSIAATL